jgi:sulfur-oxidizing protein SoxY
MKQRFRQEKPLHWPRRTLLKGGSALLGAALWPAIARSSVSDVEDSIIALYGKRPIQAGRVTVKIPPISENGYSVPITVDVQSPMTRDDHVVRIAVFAEENPLPDVARFQLGPAAGRARVQTRIRMGASQRIRAVAEMSDGSLWSGYAFSIVTLAACVL